MKRILIATIILIVIFSGCIFDSNDKDEESKTDGNVIAEGHITGEDIYGNIVIWTEEKSESRNLYYYDIQTKEAHNALFVINHQYASVLETFLH